MDGPFYADLRTPHLISDQGQVTLATTNKALIPASELPAFGANYFIPGKKVRMRAFGKISTILTPGNGQFAFYWGSGADATGTILASSTAQALVASQTNLSWMFDVTVTCRARGSGTNGSLFLSGFALFSEGVSVAHILIPGSAPAAVGVDTTVANVISPQFNRSGSTAEVMTLQELEVQALN